MHKPRRDNRAAGWAKRPQPITQPCVVVTVLADGGLELSQAGLSNVVRRQTWAEAMPLIRDLFKATILRVRAE